MYNFNNNWFNQLEDKEIEKTEVTYDIKIEIKKEVEDKIKWLTYKYPEEISAFLTGTIKDSIIIIDGLLFPHQDVSQAGVEVEPKDLVKLRKEYGDECLRIIGHWHSHNTMGCFWSATDNAFIDSYSKTKEISIFFVSSTQSKCRVMLVINKPFNIRIDNLEYETIWSDKKFENDLKNVIEEKVTKRTYQDKNRNIYDFDNDWKSYNPSKDSEEQNIRNKVNQSIKYNDEIGFIYVKDLDFAQAEILRIETKEYLPQLNVKGKGYEVVYKSKDKERAIELIKNIKFYLQDIFEEELNNGYYLD